MVGCSSFVRDVSMNESQQKICSKCHIQKPLSEFYRHDGNKDALRRDCKNCTKKQIEKHRQEHPEVRRQHFIAHKERFRAEQRERKYRLNPTRWAMLYAKQKGCCAICHRSVSVARMHTDHNHQTDKVRGLLCGTCNTALGHFHDSTLLLESAIAYLRGSL